ncbi:hypothetical protein ACWDAZ_36220, partial [Streptomyces sp. NPDC001215]
MTSERGTTEVSRQPARAEDRQGFDEVHILWISEGMSCDGDTVAMTEADQQGIEDVVLGLVPGLPKVNLHNNRRHGRARLRRPCRRRRTDRSPRHPSARD